MTQQPASASGPPLWPCWQADCRQVCGAAWDSAPSSVWVRDCLSFCEPEGQARRLNKRCPWLKGGLGNVLSSVRVSSYHREDPHLMTYWPELCTFTWATSDTSLWRTLPCCRCCCLKATERLWLLIASDVSPLPAPRTLIQGLCKLLNLLNCPSKVKVLKCSCNNLSVRTWPD